MKVTHARHEAPERQATTPEELFDILGRYYNRYRSSGNNAWTGGETVRFIAVSLNREVTVEFTRDEWARFAPLIYS
jgi:hypothetical protein